MHGHRPGWNFRRPLPHARILGLLDWRYHPDPSRRIRINSQRDHFAFPAVNSEAVTHTHYRYDSHPRLTGLPYATIFREDIAEARSS